MHVPCLPHCLCLLQLSLHLFTLPHLNISPIAHLSLVQDSKLYNRLIIPTMSTYDDYPPPPRQRRPPPPDDRLPPPSYPSKGDPYASDTRRPRQQQRFESDDRARPPPGRVPPPPVGDALNGNDNSRMAPSALKREGSRSRAPDLRPEFPDEASYLGANAPDLERKNRAIDRKFREKRDGYTSEEGEMLRQAKPSRRPPKDAYDEPEPRRRRPRDAYDDQGLPPPARRRDRDDEREPPRRKRDPQYDDEIAAPRRRGERPGVEYGSEPIPVRRSNTERPRRRRDDYDGYPPSEDDDRGDTRRHRSQEDRRRRRDPYAEDKYDDRRRRDDPYAAPRRRERSRGRYDDEDDSDDYDRYDSRRDRDRKKAPREIKVGKYDIGPMVDQGKKHYATLAPILTPIVMSMARKYMTGSGGKR